MNSALLPILARLHSLQVVSRLGTDGSRVVASRTDPNPITVMLREINETVLGRTLHFTSENDSALSVEVSGRRILRLTHAKGLPGAEACLAAHSLDHDQKDDLIKLLQTFAAPRQEIRVCTTSSGQTAENVNVGLPVALIADLLLVELNGLDAELTSEAAPPAVVETPVQSTDPDVSGSFIARFARANGPVLMAWLITGGEDDGLSEGTEEMVEHLKAFLEDEIKDLGVQLDRIAPAPGAPVCIALGAGLSQGHSIICAKSQDGLLLGLAEGDCTQTLMSAWSHAFF